MAGTATATYTTDVWTSPSIDGGQWEYAVPIRQDSTKHRSKSRSSHDSHARSRERNSKGSRSSSLSRHAYAHEHLTSRGRPQASHSRRGSEAGSSRSIYGHDVASRSAGNVKDSTDSLYRKGSVRHGEWHEGMGMYTDEIDQDNWIHRDKLAKIESEELQQAAILLQRRAGEGNKTRTKNYDSYGTPASSPPTEQLEPWPSLHGDSQLREHSGSPTFPEEGEERGRWDSRRQEEGMANGAAGFYRNPGLRKSSSRIPIPSGIPVPVSPNPENGGREFSKQRSRANTHGDDDTLSFGMPRRASEPMSVDSAQNITPAGSRPGSRGNTLQNAAGRKTTKGGATNRKTSAPPSTTRKATPRSRAPSSTLRATKAAENRPINRPEGDPPWLATMYKPDPRLPPDQQILPTHARRMQQEQWEKEGKTPTTYDREFAPLAIGPDGPKPSEKPAPKEEEPEPEPIEQNEKVEKEEVQEQKTPNLETPSKESGRPNSGTGYSTMPRVHEPPQAALQPKWSPPVVTAQEPPPKEKGCGCCIVM